MGQKVNPIGLRVGINRTWESRWFAKGEEYADLLHEDLKIREFLKKKLKNASVSRIVIERPHKKCRITIYTARPGVVIGKKGADIETLRRAVSKMVDGEVFLNLVEVRKPEIDANLVAESVAQQLERRVAFRRAMKRSLQTAMRMGALGCKIMCGGRLGGAEIARTKSILKGRCRCTRCAPTLITALPKPRRPWASSGSRCGSTKVRSSSTIRWLKRSACWTQVSSARGPAVRRRKRDKGVRRCFSRSAPNSARRIKAGFTAWQRAALR
jgi:small subunit ribosomal protein S3